MSYLYFIRHIISLLIDQSIPLQESCLYFRKNASMQTSFTGHSWDNAQFAKSSLVHRSVKYSVLLFILQLSPEAGQSTNMFHLVCRADCIQECCLLIKQTQRVCSGHGQAEPAVGDNDTKRNSKVVKSLHIFLRPLWVSSHHPETQAGLIGDSELLDWCDCDCEWLYVCVCHPVTAVKGSSTSTTW